MNTFYQSNPPINLTGPVTGSGVGNIATSVAMPFPYYRTLSNSLSLGTSNPLSLSDSLMATLSPGGSLAGNGVLGVVAASFSSLANETGTGSNQGGLGTSASVSQPYNPTDFAGLHGFPCSIKNISGDSITLADMLTTISDISDRDSLVHGYLSYRSDLGANLKWRLWFYYRANATGYETPFTPDISITNATLQVRVVEELGNIPISSFQDIPQFGQVAAAIGAKAIGTAQLDDSIVTYAKIQNVSATDKLLGRASIGSGVVEEIICTSAGRALLDDVSVSAQITTLGLDNTKKGAIGFSLGDNSTTISTGLIGYICVNYSGTITGWSIVAGGTSPTCTIDVWKIASGTNIPTVTNTIMGTKPALSTGNAVISSNLTGWTTATFSVNDIFGFYIDAISNATFLEFKLHITKT